MFFKTAFAVRDLSPVIHCFGFFFCKCIVHFSSFIVLLTDNTESISAQQTPSRGRFAAYSSPHFNLIHRTFHARNTGRFALKYCTQNIAKIRSCLRLFSFKPAPKRLFRANFAIFLVLQKIFRQHSSFSKKLARFSLIVVREQNRANANDEPATKKRLKL